MPPPDMSMAQKSLEVQAQIRRNAEETSSYLSDVSKWEKEFKKKDAELRAKKKKKKKVPPPRNSAPKSTTYDPTAIRESGGLISTGFTNASPEDYQIPQEALDSMKKSTHDPTTDEQTHRGVMLGGGTGNSLTPASAVKAASAYDGKTPIPKPKPRKSRESLEDEERVRGNEAYKNRDFDLAIKSYTRCLGYNMKSVVAFSNRAMAYLKLKEWVKAEKDADAAIAIDPSHIKSYQRRSAARVSLGKLRAALADLKIAERLTDGPSKQLFVEIRKCREALKDAVHRAPKKRIPVKIDTNMTLPPAPTIMEANEDGVFDVDKAAPHPPPAASKIATAPTPTVKLPKRPPKNSYEFEKAWNSLKADPAQQANYLYTHCDPGSHSSLNKIFKSGFQDADIFTAIVATFSEKTQTSIAEGENAVVKLRGFWSSLASVKNVDMMAMMLSGDLRKVLSENVIKVFGEEKHVPQHIKKKLF